MSEGSAAEDGQVADHRAMTATQPEPSEYAGQLTYRDTNPPNDAREVAHIVMAETKDPSIQLPVAVWRDEQKARLYAEVWEGTMPNVEETSVTSLQFGLGPDAGGPVVEQFTRRQVEEDRYDW